MLHENNALPRLLAVSGEFFKSMLLLLALMAVSENVRAEEVEFVFSDFWTKTTQFESTTISKEGITIAFAQNASTDKITYSNVSNSKSMWMYNITSTNLNNGKTGATMTITAAKTITKVVITYLANSATPNTSYFNSGTYSNGTWKGSTTSLVMMNKNTSNSIKMTKVVVTIQAPATIALAKACTDGTRYYGTYSSGTPFVVPSDLTVSEIQVVDGKLQLSDYVTGNVVPANTGVMVSSESNDNHSVAPSGQVGTSKLGANNMLKPSGSGISADAMYATDTKFYRLTMHNGTQIGFWWGAEDGVAFDLGANKAYLAVPDAAAARLQGLWLGDDTEGIAGMNREAADDSHPVYDLQGRQIVNGKSANGKWQRGLYIQNGRKVVKR